MQETAAASDADDPLPDLESLQSTGLVSDVGMQQDNAVQDGEPQPEGDGSPAAAERANGVDWTAKDDDRTNPETLEELEPEAPDLQVLIGA